MSYYWTVTGNKIENIEVKPCTALLTPPPAEPSFDVALQANVVGRHRARMTRKFPKGPWNNYTINDK